MVPADSALVLTADALPKAVVKRLRGLAHHLVSWEQALRDAAAHFEKGRFDSALTSHLQLCFAAVPAPAVQVLPSMILRLFFPPSDLGASTVQGTVPLAALSPAGRALLHLPGLRRYWAATLRGSLLEDLRLRLPRAWIVDPQTLPPSAAIAGLDIARWADLHRLRDSGRYFEVGGGDATVLLSPETEKEEWREIGERLQSATPGMHWVAEVADEAGAWVAEARYALTDGRWEMESMEGIA